jgi:membrane fusion protein (multidrug efflux system)
VEAAQAAVESARLNLQWTSVTSPIDGISGIAKAQIGDLVSTTTLLTTVSQLNPIKVTFPISEREYLRFAERIRKHEEEGAVEQGAIKGGPPLQMILADGSTYRYPGHFYVANRQVNVQTGTILVEGLFPNPNDILRPGLYAKIRAATDVERGALLVPQSAVLATQGQLQVAVVNADNRVSLRMVKTGKEFGHLRIIKHGLKPGERVVVKGLQKVRDGMEVKARLVAIASSAAPVAAAQPASPAVSAQSAHRP